MKAEKKISQPPGIELMIHKIAYFVKLDGFCLEVKGRSASTCKAGSPPFAELQVYS